MRISFFLNGPELLVTRGCKIIMLHKSQLYEVTSQEVIFGLSQIFRVMVGNYSCMIQMIYTINKK